MLPFVIITGLERFDPARDIDNFIACSRVLQHRFDKLLQTKTAGEDHIRFRDPDEVLRRRFVGMGVGARWKQDAQIDDLTRDL